MCLRGLPPDGWVTVVCTACRRSGRSRVARLLTQYGPDVAALDLLRNLTQACSHQHDPGSGKRRKYVPTCLATIGLPISAKAVPVATDLPTPGSAPYSIETWIRPSRTIELHLAVVYPIDMAHAAFDAACARWPTSEITLSQGSRVLRHHNRPHQDLPGGGRGT